MKTLTFKLKPSAVMVGLTVMAVLAVPLYLNDTNSTGDGSMSLFPVAYAAEEGGQAPVAERAQSLANRSSFVTPPHLREGAL